MSEAGEPDASSASLTDGANDNIADDGNGEKHMDSSPGAEKVMDNAGENVDDTTDENISVVKEVGAEEISPPSMEEISEAEEENLSETKESSAEVRDEVKEGTPEFAENSPENEEVSEENEDISPEHEEISPQDTETSPQNEEISQDNEEISEENEEKISEENEESSREDAEMSPQNEEISQESSLNEGMSPQHEEISEENEVTSQENEDISQDGESNDADVTEEKEVEDLPENTDKSETGDVDEMLEEKDAESEKDNAEPMEENRVTESPTNEDELLEDEQGTTEEKEEDQGKKMQEAVDEEDINAESKEENRVTESQIDEDELLEDEEDATDKMVEDQGQEMTEAVDEKDNTESKEENRVTESPINEDELLEDNQDTKEDRVEGQKLEMQEALDEDKLLETTEEKNEGAEVSPSADGSEKKSSESENQESQDSTGDMTLQIGSVTGNAEMLEDAEMMDVDQDSSKQNGDQENQKMDSDESKKIDDVEMVDAKKDDETKQDDQSEKDEKMEKDAKVKSVDTDVEMKDDEKKEESEGKLTTVKEEPGQTKTDSKPAEDDDIKIIDIPSDDDDQSGSKGVKAVVKEEKKEEKPGEDGGEMCLQIASVSGGVDMLDQNDDEKNDVKKVDGIQVKEESSALKSSDIKQEVKSPESKPKSASKTQTCIVCQKIGKCKYNIVRNGDIKHLCDDVCFKQFRANPTMFLRASSDGQPAKKPDSPAQAPVQAPPIAPPPQERYKTCSICQLMNVKTSKPFLNWQGMDFCGEDCLGKFQGGLNAACNYCGQTVQQTSKGKFCARIGNDVKQFCSGPCFNEFKKRQKLCEFCQKDVTKISDAFVAPVGKDALFKDFCSQDCLQKYEEKSNRDIEIVGIERPKKSQVPPKGNFQCAVCRKTGPVKHEIKLEGKMNRLCSDPCFSAFQYANKLTMNTCDNCGVYCYNEGMAPQYIQFEGQQKRFCSFMCVNTFKTLNKKVVSCAWCNCKKSNFDMIERVDANNKYQLFCSLNCLSLYRVNLQATSNQAVMCDQCRKFVPAQYHLTMSDASVRNFCSYQCVMTFQSQFAGGTKTQTPIMNTGNQQKPAAPAPANSRTSTRASTGPKSARANTAQQKQPNIPIISNVVSLSNQNAAANKTSTTALTRGVPQQVRANQMPTLVNSQVQQIRPIMTTTSMQTPPQQIIIQPPPPKTVKNKSLLCKPFVQTKATSCRPHTQTKETQTEEDWEPKKCLVPIPIPYFIPVPMMMYSQYTPVPLPIPIPIPVPCFIPTTKKSASSILKQIKEIQERIPNDPLEAELLMMAEAVAVAEPESESESENEDILPVSKATLAGDGTTVSPPPSPLTNSVPVREATPTPSQPNGEFSEDMLQMALRMATEMTSEPVLDLETSIDPVPVNTEPPPPPPPAPPATEEDVDEDPEYTPVRETRSRGRGPKRSGSRGGRKSKRQKVSHPVEQEVKMDVEPATEPEVPEVPADANMYLKFTYGVNAWKHWVVLKNAQLEKVSKHGSGKLKLFKTDMMGCSADELNYSLCLFVKEVRKPNGEEYAPDSIYYLCLGIQQYLFESGRIDNIFTDMYYEKFTECLNEVLNRYEPKLNAAGQLVCRIEEEHLWECKQLGAHSPHVLLNTLVFFNTKYFMLKEVDDHMKLSFTHIMKHWKKTPIGKNNTTGRSVYLRYYCPNPAKVTPNDISKKSKQKEELPVYEQCENLDNPLRCPVKLYEFYLSKCPESIKNRNDAFYLTPERSCVPDSPVWYSTQNLASEAMHKMLNRARLVREIQEAMIHTQPVYM